MNPLCKAASLTTTRFHWPPATPATPAMNQQTPRIAQAYESQLESASGLKLEYSVGHHHHH
eukprot:10547920-Karenia_brevis.AAC.1